MYFCRLGPPIDLCLFQARVVLDTSRFEFLFLFSWTLLKVVSFSIFLVLAFVFVSFLNA